MTFNGLFQNAFVFLAGHKKRMKMEAHNPAASKIIGNVGESF